MKNTKLSPSLPSELCRRRHHPPQQTSLLNFASADAKIERSFVSNLNKLLIVQGIIKIDRQTDPAFVSFGCYHDVLEQCRECQAYDEAKDQLNAIKLQNTGIMQDSEDSDASWDLLTIKKKQSSEMSCSLVLLLL
ncbi:hypothetical protein EDC96DRAFT_581313 [Choanephora cucurbitarum]|nr:hypothetical protein EDC96DRAFT_581313 [Choanephora cucurbitarum]